MANNNTYSEFLRRKGYTMSGSYMAQDDRYNPGDPERATRTADDEYYGDYGQASYAQPSAPIMPEQKDDGSDVLDPKNATILQPKPYTANDVTRLKLTGRADSLHDVGIIGKQERDSLIKEYSRIYSNPVDSAQIEREEDLKKIRASRSSAQKDVLFSYLDRVNNVKIEGPIASLINKERFHSKINPPLTRAATWFAEKEEEVAEKFKKKYLSPDSVIDESLLAIAAAEQSAILNATMLRDGIVDELRGTIIDENGKLQEVNFRRDNNGVAMIYLSNMNLESEFHRYLSNPDRFSDKSEPIDDLWIPQDLRDMADSFEKTTGRKVSDDEIRAFTVNNPAGRLFIMEDAETRRYLEQNLISLNSRIRARDKAPAITADRFTSTIGFSPRALRVIETSSLSSRVNDAIRDMRKDKKGEGDIAANFATGFSEDLGEKALSAVTFGVADLMKEMPILGVLTKSGKLIDKYGLPHFEENMETLLSEDERLFFEVFNTALAADQYIGRDISGAYAAGSALSDAVAHTASFILGGGILRGVSKAAASGLAKISAKKASGMIGRKSGMLDNLGSTTGARAQGATTARAFESVLGQSSRKLGYQVGKIYYSGASAVGRALVTPTAYVDAYMRSVNTDNYAVSVFDDFSKPLAMGEIDHRGFIATLPSSMYNTIVDGFTEQFSVSGLGLSAIAAPLSKTAIGKLALGSKWVRGYDDFVRSTRKSALGRYVSGVWHGTPRETMEEVEAAFFKGELNAQFFEEQNLINLFSATVGLGLLFGAPGSINFARQKFANRTRNRDDYKYFMDLGVSKEALDGLVDILDTQSNYFKAATLNHFHGAILGNIPNLDKKKAVEATGRLADFTMRNTMNSLYDKTADPDAKIIGATVEKFIRAAQGKALAEAASSMVYDENSNIAIVGYTDAAGAKKQTYATNVEFNEDNSIKSITLPGKKGKSVVIDGEALANYEVNFTTAADYQNKQVKKAVDDFYPNISFISESYQETLRVRREESKAKREELLERIKSGLAAPLKSKDDKKKSDDKAPDKEKTLRAVVKKKGSKIKFQIDDNEDLEDISFDDLMETLGDENELRDVNLDDIVIETAKVSVEDAIKDKIRRTLLKDSFFAGLPENQKQVFIDKAYEKTLEDEYDRDTSRGMASFEYENIKRSRLRKVRLRYSNWMFNLSSDNIFTGARLTIQDTDDEVRIKPGFRGMKIARTLFVKLGNSHDLLVKSNLEGATATLHVEKVDDDYEIGVIINLANGSKFHAQLATKAKMDALLKDRIIDKIEMKAWAKLKESIVRSEKEGRVVNFTVGIGIPKMSVSRDSSGDLVYRPPFATNVHENDYFETQSLMYAGQFYDYDPELGEFRVERFPGHVGARSGLSIKLRAPIIKDKIRYVKARGEVIREPLAELLWAAMKDPTREMSEIANEVLARHRVPVFAHNKFFHINSQGEEASKVSVYLNAILHLMSRSTMSASEFLSIFLSPEADDNLSLRFSNNRIKYGSAVYDIDFLNFDDFKELVLGKNLSMNPEFIYENASTRAQSALKISGNPVINIDGLTLDTSLSFIDFNYKRLTYTVLNENAFEPEFLYLVHESGQSNEKSTQDFSDETIEFESSDFNEIQQARIDPREITIDENLGLVPDEDAIGPNPDKILFKVDDTDSEKIDKATNKLTKNNFFNLLNVPRHVRRLASRMIMKGMTSVIERVFGVKVIVGDKAAEERLMRAREENTEVHRKFKKLDTKKYNLKGFIIIDDKETGQSTIYLSNDVLHTKIHELAHFILDTLGIDERVEVRDALEDFMSSQNKHKKYRFYKKREVNEEMFCDRLGDAVTRFHDDANFLKLTGIMIKSFMRAVVSGTDNIKDSTYHFFAKDVLSLKLSDIPFASSIMKKEDLTVKQKRGIIQYMAPSSARDEFYMKRSDPAFEKFFNGDVYDAEMRRYPDQSEEMLLLKCYKDPDRPQNLMKDGNGANFVFNLKHVTDDGIIMLVQAEENTGEVNNNEKVLVYSDDDNNDFIETQEQYIGNQKSHYHAIKLALSMPPRSLFKLISYTFNGVRHYICPRPDNVFFSHTKPLHMAERNGFSLVSDLDRLASVLILKGLGAEQTLMLTGRALVLDSEYSRGGFRSKGERMFEAKLSKIRPLIANGSNGIVDLTDLVHGLSLSAREMIKHYAAEIRVSSTNIEPSYYLRGRLLVITFPTAATDADISSMMESIAYMVSSNSYYHANRDIKTPVNFLFTDSTLDKNENIDPTLRDLFVEASKMYSDGYYTGMSESELENLKRKISIQTGWVMISPQHGHFSTSILIDELSEFLESSPMVPGMVAKFKISDLVKVRPSIFKIFGLKLSEKILNTLVKVDFSSSEYSSYSGTNNVIEVNLDNGNRNAYSEFIHEFSHAVNMPSSRVGKTVDMRRFFEININNRLNFQRLINVLRHGNKKLRAKLITPSIDDKGSITKEYYEDLASFLDLVSSIFYGEGSSDKDVYDSYQGLRKYNEKGLKYADILQALISEHSNLFAKKYASGSASDAESFSLDLYSLILNPRSNLNEYIRQYQEFIAFGSNLNKNLSDRINPYGPLSLLNHQDLTISILVGDMFFAYNYKKTADRIDKRKSKIGFSVEEADDFSEEDDYDYYEDYDEDYDDGEFGARGRPEPKPISVAGLSEIVDGEISNAAITAESLEDFNKAVDAIMEEYDEKYVIERGKMGVKQYIRNRKKSMIRAALKSVTGFKEILNYIPYSRVDGSHKIIDKKVMRSMLRDIAITSGNFESFKRALLEKAEINHVIRAVCRFEPAARMLGIRNYYERLYTAYNKKSSTYTNAFAVDLTADRKETLLRQLMYSIKSRLNNMRVFETDSSGNKIITGYNTINVKDETGATIEKSVPIYKTINVFPATKKAIEDKKGLILSLYNRIQNADLAFELIKNEEFAKNGIKRGWSHETIVDRFIIQKTYELLDYICDVVGTSFSEDVLMIYIYESELAYSLNTPHGIDSFVKAILLDIDPAASAGINQYSAIGSFIAGLESINNRTEDTTVKSIDNKSHSGVVQYNGFSYALRKIQMMTNNQFDAFMASNPYFAHSRLIEAARSGDWNLVTNLKLGEDDSTEAHLMLSDLYHILKGYMPLGKIAAMGVRHYVETSSVLPIFESEDDVYTSVPVDEFIKVLTPRFSEYAASEIDSAVKNQLIYARRKLRETQPALIDGYHIDKDGNMGKGCYVSEYMDGVSVNLDGIVGAKVGDVSLKSVPLKDAINKVMSITKLSTSEAGALVKKRIIENGVILDGLKEEMLETVEVAIMRNPDEVYDFLTDDFIVLGRKMSSYSKEELSRLNKEALLAGYTMVPKYLMSLENEKYVNESSISGQEEVYDEYQDADRIETEGDSHFYNRNDIDPIERISRIIMSEKSKENDILGNPKYISFLANLFICKRISEIEASKAIYGHPGNYGGISGLEKRAQSFNTSFSLAAEYQDNSVEFANNTFVLMDVPDILTVDPAYDDPVGETLGAVLMSPYLMKEMMIRCRGWSDDMEVAFNDIVESKEGVKNKIQKFSNLFNSLKLIYCGKFDLLGSTEQKIIKAQWFPIFEAEDPELLPHFERLLHPDPKRRVHAISFKDSVKAGYVENHIYRLKFSDLGMVSIPTSHYDNETSLLRRLILHGDEKVLAAANAIMLKNVESLIRRFIKEDGSINTIEILEATKNINKPVELAAVNELLNLAHNYPECNIFEISGVPSLLYDVITAIVRKAFDIKLPGSPYTATPAVFMSSKRLMYINENNKAEVMLPLSAFSSIVKDLTFDEAVEKLERLGYIGKTSSIVILKNPVQSEGSISNASVVGVFPDIYGQAIATPAGFLAASGSDNDGDKIFAYTSKLHSDAAISSLVDMSVENKTKEDIATTDADLAAFINEDKKYPSIRLPRFVSQYIAESSGLGFVGLAVSLSGGHEALMKFKTTIVSGSQSFTLDYNLLDQETKKEVSSAKSGMTSLAVDVGKVPLLQTNNVDLELYIPIFAFGSVSGSRPLMMKLMKMDIRSIEFPEFKGEGINFKYLNKRYADGIVELAWEVVSNPDAYKQSDIDKILTEFGVFLQTMTSLGSLYMTAKKMTDFADVIRNKESTFGSIIKTKESLQKRISKNPIKIARMESGIGMLDLSTSYGIFSSILRALSGTSLTISENMLSFIQKTEMRTEHFAEMFNAVGILRGYSVEKIQKTLSDCVSKYNLTFNFDLYELNYALTSTPSRLFKLNSNIFYIHSVNFSNKTILKLLEENPHDQTLIDFITLYNSSSYLSPFIRRVNKLFSANSVGVVENFSKKSTDLFLPESRLPLPGTPLPAYVSVRYGIAPLAENRVVIDETTFYNASLDSTTEGLKLKANYRTHEIHQHPNGETTRIKLYSGHRITMNGALTDHQVDVVKNMGFFVGNKMKVATLEILPRSLGNMLSQFGKFSALIIGDDNFAGRYFEMGGDLYTQRSFNPNEDYETNYLIVDVAVLNRNKIADFYDYSERTETPVIFITNDISEAPSSSYSAQYEATKVVTYDTARPEDIDAILKDNSHRMLVSSNKYIASVIATADKSNLKSIYVRNPKTRKYTKVVGAKKAENGDNIVTFSGGSVVNIGQNIKISRYLRLDRDIEADSKSVLILVPRGLGHSKTMELASKIKGVNDIKIIEINKSNGKYLGLVDDDSNSKHCAI